MFKLGNSRWWGPSRGYSLSRLLFYGLLGFGLVSLLSLLIFFVSLNGVSTAGLSCNSRVIGLALVLVLLLLALSLLHYLRIRRDLVAPILEMVGTMRHIACDKNFSRRVPSQLPVEELAQLSRYFNYLLATVHEHNEQLRDMTYRDYLTGLFNRRRFEELLQQELSRAKRHGHPFSLVLFDLDNFKYINDTFGHPMGDQAIRAVATILRDHSRASDSVARLGGDEFAILLPETAPEDAMRFAQKIHQIFTSRELVLPIGATHIGVSAAVSGYPADGDSISDLFIAVDVALYKAKKGGRNRIVRADAESDRQAMMEIFHRGSFIQSALEQGRLEVHAEPVVALCSGEVQAYELLARIRPAEGGDCIEAREFIDVAVELGLIRELDEQMLELALQGMAEGKWGDNSLFVNLSTLTLMESQRLFELPLRCQQLGIDAQRLVIDVSERDLLPRMSGVAEQVEWLRSQGIRLALDDFGAGLHSFSHLSSLLVEYVKIDGGFVHRQGCQQEGQVLLRHMVALARDLGITTMAERVEDAETVALLQEIGIDLAQGRYFSGKSRR